MIIFLKCLVYDFYYFFDVQVRSRTSDREWGGVGGVGGVQFPGGVQILGNFSRSYWLRGVKMGPICLIISTPGGAPPGGVPGRGGTGGGEWGRVGCCDKFVLPPTAPHPI